MTVFTVVRHGTKMAASVKRKYKTSRAISTNGKPGWGLSMQCIRVLLAPWRFCQLRINRWGVESYSFAVNLVSFKHEAFYPLVRITVFAMSVRYPLKSLVENIDSASVLTSVIFRHGGTSAVSCCMLRKLHFWTQPTSKNACTWNVSLQLEL